eukprot:TRINITY_DN265_c0_g2_i1.p2 TRINITY_DN265_c0_g2~~TRINITY_DN265_c0_g2_i1.p2  ORF type:complete len:228 (-),score=51.93 TRINITY_DN265_c0_g2_i1:271-954(-)
MAAVEEYNGGNELAAVITSGARGPEIAQSTYDNWAGAGTYDKDLSNWDYQAPVRIATLSEEYGMDKAAPVLDVGCGTGMSGEAMKAKGFTSLHGGDISPVSLEVIKKEKAGLYLDLKVVDMEVIPYGFPEGLFGGVVCIGVLSYVQNIEATFREWIRLTKPSAKIAFTHREDLLLKEGDDCRSGLERLCAEGLWKKLYESEPESYLPNAPCEVERSLRIRSFVFEKL